MATETQVGPWTKYANAAQGGPWTKYAKAQQQPAPNPYAQFVQPEANPYAQFVQGASRADLSQAFYAAKQAGDEAQARQIIGQIQKSGMTLAPMNDQQENAAFQKQNAANVAAQSPLETFMQGAGKSVVDTGRGLAELVGMESPQDVAQARQMDQALANSTAGKLGDLAGQAAQMYVTGGALGAGAKALGYTGRVMPYVTSALTSGAFNGAQPIVPGQSRALNTAVGVGLGAAGEALPSVLGAVGRKLTPTYSTAKQAALDTAQRFNIPLHLTQVANSPFGKLVGSVTKWLPFSGSYAADAAQRQAWNRALAATMGEDSGELTQDLVSHAKGVAGNDYDRILHGNQIDMDAPTMDNLAAAQAKAHTELTGEHAALVDKQIDSILNEAANNDGVIPGAKYQDLRQSLKDASSANPALKHHLGNVRSALEDAANRQLPDLAPVNARYNNIKTIERGLKQVSGANNTISPANLYHLTQGQYGATPEMKALAQLGQTVLKDPLHDSGTAQRMLAYRLLGAHGPDATAGAGALAGIAGIPHLLPMTAGLSATGATLGRFMNSPMAARVVPYLGRDIFSGLSALAQPANRLLPLVATSPAAR